jgi:hypothetical protein
VIKHDGMMGESRVRGHDTKRQKGLNLLDENLTATAQGAGATRRDYSPRGALRRVSSCRSKDFKYMA